MSFLKRTFGSVTSPTSVIAPPIPSPIPATDDITNFYGLENVSLTPHQSL